MVEKKITSCYTKRNYIPYAHTQHLYLYQYWSRHFRLHACMPLNVKRCPLLAAWVVDLFVVAPVFVQSVFELVQCFRLDNTDRKFIPVVDDSVC